MLRIILADDAINKLNKVVIEILPLFFPIAPLTFTSLDVNSVDDI